MGRRHYKWGGDIQVAAYFTEHLEIEGEPLRWLCCAAIAAPVEPRRPPLPAVCLPTSVTAVT